MSPTKERPILFSAPMVRAILEGRKTVTRRAVKFPFIDRAAGCELSGNEIGPEEVRNNCPYGVPGQRLWVRETFATLSAGEYEPVKPHSGRGQNIMYAATDPLADLSISNRGYGYRPSIHMPRWVSRILLEITDVRVERLQDITEEQAKAEGVRLYTDHAELGDWWHVEGIETYSADPRKSFELLWSSVGGDWQSNPWVWVVEFKRVTP